MPIVHIEVLQGRDRAVLRSLVRRVTHVVAEELETDATRVRVLVREVDPELWGVGGEVLADRVRVDRPPEGSVSTPTCET